MGAILSAALSITSNDTIGSNVGTHDREQSSECTDTPMKMNETLLATRPVLHKPNKWNFQGDYHNNWEKNLIPLNKKMQNDYYKSMISTKHWIRTLRPNQDINFPEYINIIVAEFFVLPRCSSCGKYDNLWLNTGDGFIGCGRKFYALKSMGGNGCSLTHYNEWKSGQHSEHEPPPSSITVKLGTISANGADVFDYEQQAMIFNADTGEGKHSEEDETEKANSLSLDKLKHMLRHWGIEMNRMYLYDKTFHSNQIMLDDTFSRNSYNAFVEQDDDD